jgi:hypothetical protein
MNADIKKILYIFVHVRYVFMSGKYLLVGMLDPWVRRLHQNTSIMGAGTVGGMLLGPFSHIFYFGCFIGVMPRKYLRVSFLLQFCVLTHFTHPRQIMSPLAGNFRVRLNAGDFYGLNYKLMSKFRFIFGCVALQLD